MISPVIVGAKSVAWLSKKLGRGSGSAAPGLLIERFRPQLLATQLHKLPEGVVIITGTNGKTTTTKMVVQMLESQGLRVLTNRSGSNFTRGILAMLSRESSVTGRLDFDIAVLELDEAYSRLIAAQVTPRLILALNVHRDQLDRYGEIDKTAKLIGDAMQHCESIVVNADDPLLVAQVLRAKQAKVSYFGLSDTLRAEMPTDEELHKEAIPGTPGARSPHAQTLLDSVKDSGLIQNLTVVVDGASHTVDFSLLGLHNAANAIAALAAVRQILPRKKVAVLTAMLADMTPAFGRGEVFVVQGKKVLFGLVKNPSGFNQNLKTMLKKPVQSVLIAVNDEYADGRDVSWLWDVDFDAYSTELNEVKLYISGVRAYDMALRLQQIGIQANVVNNNLSEVLDMVIESSSEGDNVVIFPTYTAMLRLRKLLNKYVVVEDIHG